MRTRNHRWRKMKSGLASALSFVAAVLVVAPLGLVFLHLIRNGAASINWDFLTQLPKPVGVLGGGMAIAIVGSFELLGLASALSFVAAVLVVAPLGLVFLH